MEYSSIAEYGILGSYARFKTGQKPECDLLGYDKEFILMPQKKITIYKKRYILDFFVPHGKIAVEVDGRQFHSTNKQREYDYERERNLIMDGYHVLRFTANQAIQEPTECFKQVYNLYCRLHTEEQG